MADNVAVTAGSGTNIATDERTINAVTVQIQRVTEIGASNITAGRVAVTNTSTDIVVAKETRKRVVITNRQTVPIYVDTGTATTSDFKLDPGDSLTLYTTAAVDGITTAAYSASGDAYTYYVEEHD